MDELNSLEARKLNPVERMQKLQKAILIADNVDRVKNARLGKFVLNGRIALAVPVCLYWAYHLLHPNG